MHCPDACARRAGAVQAPLAVVENDESTLVKGSDGFRIDRDFRTVNSFFRRIHCSHPVQELIPECSELPECGTHMQGTPEWHNPGAAGHPFGVLC